jgi:hypothetical protein
VSADHPSYGKFSSLLFDFRKTHEMLGCPFRKLYPIVLVVQAAEEVASDYAPAALDRPLLGRSLAQAKVGACQIVIGGIGTDSVGRYKSLRLGIRNRQWKTIHLGFELWEGQKSEKIQARSDVIWGIPVQ